MHLVRSGTLHGFSQMRYGLKIGQTRMHAGQQNCKERRDARISSLQALHNWNAGATSPIARALCISLYRHGATVVLGCHGPSSCGEELMAQLHAVASTQHQHHHHQQQQQQQQQQGGTQLPAIIHCGGEMQHEVDAHSGQQGASEAPRGKGEAEQDDAQLRMDGGKGLQAGPDSADDTATGSMKDRCLGMGRLLHVPCDFSSLDGAKACADAYEVGQGSVANACSRSLSLGILNTCFNPQGMAHKRAAVLHMGPMTCAHSSIGAQQLLVSIIHPERPWGRLQNAAACMHIFYVTCCFMGCSVACAKILHVLPWWLLQALGLPLHILINCASTISTAFKLTPDNLEEHFGVNHLVGCGRACECP